MYISSIICLRLFISLAFSFTFLDFLVFKHAECRLKRFKPPAAVKKIDYSKWPTEMCCSMLSPAARRRGNSVLLLVKRLVLSLLQVPAAIMRDDEACGFLCERNVGLCDVQYWVCVCHRAYIRFANPAICSRCM